MAATDPGSPDPTSDPGAADPGRRYHDLERPPLDGRALARALTPQPWREVRVVQRTASTNADLVEAAAAGEPAGLVVVAEEQTAGRGRLGRGWEAPPRAALLLSVLLRPAAPVGTWGQLPLVGGLAAAEAVEAVTGLDVRLKWPNDLLVGERKLAGLLAEAVSGPAGEAVVLGLGLNVLQREDELPVPPNAPGATSVALAGAAADRDPLLRAVLRRLAERLAAWDAAAAAGDEATLEDLLDDYRARCLTVGLEVEVAVPGGTPVRGEAVAVDALGRLVVAHRTDPTGATRRAVAAGDVTHVRVAASGP